MSKTQEQVPVLLRKPVSEVSQLLTALLSRRWSFPSSQNQNGTEASEPQLDTSQELEHEPLEGCWHSQQKERQ